MEKAIFQILLGSGEVIETLALTPDQGRLIEYLAEEDYIPAAYYTVIKNCVSPKEI